MKQRMIEIGNGNDLGLTDILGWKEVPALPRSWDLTTLIATTCSMQCGGSKTSKSEARNQWHAPLWFTEMLP